MSFPQTRPELEDAGFTFDTVGRCRGVRCKADLHWWFTPKGKRIPLDPDGTPHWATCVDQAQFKKPRRG